MFRTISIIIFSAAISFATIAAQANNEAKPQIQQTKITIYDAKNTQNEQTNLIKGTELTPDCEYPWIVQKFNNLDGLQVIQINNGKLSYQIVPSRGMAIQEAIIGNQIPVWKSPATDNNPTS